MKLSRAIRQYVAMKHAMYIQFGQGTAVLHAFNKYSGDILLRSVAKSQVIGFLHRSPLSDLSGQGKSGHAWSLQNRPYGMARDVVLIYPAFS
jgi:hypothetical protein